MMSETLRDSAESILNPEHLRPNFRKAFELANKHMASIAVVASFIRRGVDEEKELAWYDGFLLEIIRKLSDERGQNQGNDIHQDLLMEVEMTIASMVALRRPKDMYV